MRRHRAAIVVCALLLLVLGAAAFAYKRANKPVPVVNLPQRVIPIDARPPEGVRVRVEVLNASKVRGLARHVTQHLRESGFDVVSVGGAREVRDSTLVIDRTGHPDWAWRLARALGGAGIRSTPDSSRYVDLTVLVGATWRAPAEPFHP